jgi:DNA-binding response OmpR family regulator
MIAAARPSQPHPDPSTQLRVLLALRAGARRDLAMQVLRAVGYAVLVAGDVIEALRRLEDGAAHLVVVEASLPGRGLRLVRATRWARVPVRFLLAGEDDVSDQPVRFELGHAFPYLPAPWEPLDLAQRVTQLAEESPETR